MICVGIDVAKDKHDCLSSAQKAKSLQMYLPSQTTQRALTRCCKPFAAVLVRKTK